MNEIESFFGQIPTKQRIQDPDTFWEDMLFILCSECGWTQKDVEETEIPFINDFMIGRDRILKQKEDEFNKKSKKRH